MVTSVWVCICFPSPDQYRMTVMATEGTLYLQIENSMARSIRSGALRLNDRLPSLRDLARQRSVSLATS